MAKAIHAFKYEDRPELARPLAELLVEHSRPFLVQAPRSISAIPLHPRRFRERKYDQAQLLAAAIARQTHRTFAPHRLRRVRDTERQVGLGEADRENNLLDAFEADASSDLIGARVLLIDDVLTTGATARAAAVALRRAGAAEVQVLTLARAATV